MTITLIKATGDAYCMGRMIGQAIADTVQRVSLHNEEFIVAEQIWSGSDYLKQMQEAALQTFPKFVRELEGMADGMGQSYEKAFLWNCRGDLRWPDDISPTVAAGLSEGCTSVIIPTSAKKVSVIAHNEDGSEDFDGACFWLSAKPDDGPAFESFLYPGMIPGHTMGANAAGIVQTINNIRVHDLKPGLPRHFICRAILECHSMDEALALLNRDDRASGFHHNLGSAREGRFTSVEAPASACVITDIVDTPSVHANHLITEELKNYEQEITRSSFVRQARAESLLAAGALTDHGPTGMLFDKKPGQEILRVPTDGGDDYGQTLATGVFEMNTSGTSITVYDPHTKKIEYSTHLAI
ncbi:MAG: C45 family peptidase [Sneathiella sp.]